MPTITPLPSPPSTSDPINFSSKADAHILALQTFTTEVNAFGASLAGAGIITPIRDSFAVNATTTDLWNHSIVQDWTGTATVTNFPAAPAAGSQRISYPSAGTIITDNANISVQGNASYTVTSGDELVITAITTTTFYVTIQRKDGKALINTPSIESNSTQQYTATATLTSADFGRAATYNSATAGTLTLPAATGNQGKIIMVSNINTGICTLARAGSETISAQGLNAATSIALSLGDSLILVSTGSIWAQVSSTKNILITPSQATTSGTSIDFTGIPAWAKRITITLVGVSTSGTSNPQIQIGNGAIVTTGYTCASTFTFNSSTLSGAFTSGFSWTNLVLAANILSGQIVLNLSTANTWVCSSMLGQTVGTISISQNAGHIALAGVLDRIRLTTLGGTDTFDAGSASLMIEG